MKNTLPHIFLETNSNGPVKITTYDTELLDYIEDYLIEQCGVKGENLTISEQSANVYVMLLSKEYKLREIEGYLLKLDANEINRIYSLNN